MKKETASEDWRSYVKPNKPFSQFTEEEKRAYWRYNNAKRKANKKIILGLSSILVWFVALLIYVIFSTLGVDNSWLAFFYAVPANAVVLLSLRSAWHDFRWNKFYITTIVWGFIVAIHLSLIVVCNYNFWKLYLLGIPGLIAIFLWFRLFRPAKNKEEANHG